MTASRVPNSMREQPTLTLSARDEQELRRRVERWAHRFFGLSERDVEDCYQAAWLRVMQKVQSGCLVRNLEHFLRWEVGNSWKMELRRRQRRPSITLENCSETALDNALAPDAADEVERLEDARLLLELVASMDARRRRVLLLRDAWGLVPAEVCRLLGISRRTYREAHAQARTEIRATAGRLGLSREPRSASLASRAPVR